MRIGVFSDIHGNCIGLDAVLADLHAVDRMVCLGDAIQGGPQPAETVERLRGLNCPIVMGNADAWLLTGVDTSANETTTSKMLEIRNWSLKQLSADHIRFIESFQPTITIDLGDGQDFLCFHGSPRSFDDIILPETPDAEAQDILGDFTALVLAGGHTHLQQIRRLGRSTFFNPGSAGFGYDPRLRNDNAHFRPDPWAEYAILSYENERTSLEFRRVPFNVEMLIEVYLSSGRPYANEVVAQYRP